MAKINLSIINNSLKRATSKHEVSVELCFCAKRQRKYFSTGVKVTTTQWSDASKMVIKRKDADELNEIIQAYRARANEIISKMVKEGCCDLNVVISQMNGEDEGTSFIEYCERRRNERKVCEHTKKRYDVFIKFLKTWGKIKSFQDCNVSKVRAMDEYLHRQDKAQCTIYDYHKYLKLFINDAMIDGLIEQNPYKFLLVLSAVFRPSACLHRKTYCLCHKVANLLICLRM